MAAVAAFVGRVGSMVGGRSALVGFPVAFGAAAALVAAGAVIVMVAASWQRRWLPAEAAPRDEGRTTLAEEPPF